MTGTSIQGNEIVKEHIKCRAFRHGFSDKHTNVFQQIKDRRTVWIAYLECPDCGTRRTDVMVPNTCELISRTYDHPDNYDGFLSPQAARKIIYKELMKGNK